MNRADVVVALLLVAIAASVTACAERVPTVSSVILCNASWTHACFADNVRRVERYPRE